MTDAFGLEGRTIIVTGGAQAVGRALAEFGLARGANIALVDINAEALEQAREGWARAD